MCDLGRFNKVCKRSGYIEATDSMSFTVSLATFTTSLSLIDGCWMSVGFILLLWKKSYGKKFEPPMMLGTVRFFFVAFSWLNIWLVALSAMTMDYETPEMCMDRVRCIHPRPPDFSIGSGTSG